MVYFRIKEFKDVLAQLGLPKRGKKQDLMDRVLGLLLDEEISSMCGLAKENTIGKEGVAEIIDDTYRKMKILNVSDLSTNAQGGLHAISAKEEVDDFVTLNTRICCPCGISLPTEPVIQCMDPLCQVQQHISCIVTPEKPVESNLAASPLFYCEMCRIKRADPFWLTVAHLLLPVKFIASNIPSEHTNPLQNVEKTFQSTGTHQELLQGSEYDVQAWCMLLNDNVSFRMQWPQYADLQVNGMRVRTVNRPVSQLLGPNGRDDGALIKLYIGTGMNKISLSGCDSRPFCFGIRLVRRRTVEQVLNLIPKEKDGELFEDALARVRRCIGGGMANANEDSDSDLEVIADSITVNLRCPVSGSRMKIAGRFKHCTHMGCFDLEAFVELNQQSRKWQCPICLKNYSLEDIIIDPYFNRITTMMRHCGEEITEIEVKLDGSWTVKTKGEISDPGKWHLPDGSLCVATSDVISHFGLRVITRSSSATGKGRDEEDSSINQDVGCHVDISPGSVNEIDSISHNSDPPFEFQNKSYAPSGDADIIVLSDSDEEKVNLVSRETVYDVCQINDSSSSLAVNPGIVDSYLEVPALDARSSSCLDLFNTGVNDVGMPNWSYPSRTQASPGLQLYGTDSDISDIFIDLEHAPITFSAPVNSYSVVSKSTINSGGQILDSLVCDPNADIGFVGNPLEFVSEGPSLPKCLLTQHVQPDLEHNPPVSNGLPAEDWISLSLSSNGENFGSDIAAHAQSAATDGIDLRNHVRRNEVASVAGLNDEARSNNKNDMKFSDGPFSFPQQPRSVRKRAYVSVDSDRWKLTLFDAFKKPT